MTFRGLTVSSLTPITLTPTPVLSLNIKLPSSTYAAITASGTFLAHILSSSSSGASIADAFARPREDGRSVFEVLAGVSGGGDEGGLGVGGGRAEMGRVEEREEEEENVKIFTGPATAGAPLLSASGVLKVLRCRLLADKSITIGDHVVLVAAVEAILGVPGRKTEESALEGERMSGFNYMRAAQRSGEVGEHGRGDEEYGLMYVEGGYRRVGGKIGVRGEELGTSLRKAAVVAEEDEQVHRTIGLNVRRGDEVHRHP